MHSRPMLLSQVSIVALLAVSSALAGRPALAGDGSAAGLPAVSGVNVKFGGFGYSLGGDAAGGGFVGLAFPLGNGFGAQIDGLVGLQEGGDDIHGVGGHLFWRDPSRALFGIYASHVRWEGVSISGLQGGAELDKVALESQLYLGRISLEGFAGYQFGADTGFAGKGTVAYYPRDDLRLHVGVTHYEAPGLGGFAGFEWAPMQSRGMSLFADVGVDENHDVRTLAGVKFYFAPQDKSLIRRHREDDPEVDLPNDLFQARQSCPQGQVKFNGFCDGAT